MDILKTIFIIFEVIVLFNLIIIVHELGHFLAAKWRGLVIEKFGVWFGKPLWEKEIKGVKYSLGCIPAGGFVALPQMAPMEMLEGEVENDRKNLPEASSIDRIIVAFAGPLFSFMLAIVCAMVIWQVGRPVSESEMTTTIGYVETDSPAEKAGLLAGDTILEIDGNPVTKWSGIGNSISWQIISSQEETISVKFQRDGNVQTTVATPTKAETKAWQRDSLKQLLILPKQTPVIAKIYKNSPAEIAGLKARDIILEIGGEKIYSPQDVSVYLEKNGEKELLLLISRNDETKEVRIQPTVPAQGSDEPMLGIIWDNYGIVALSHPSPMEQISTSLKTMINTFGALFSSKSDVKWQHLAGPAGIMRIYYQLFKGDYGWQMAIWFSVIFNVNLALLNLLPLPVLDGGHITLAVIEGLTRRSINVKVLQFVQTSCAMLLIGFMLYVTFFDVQDFSNPFKRKERPPQIEFAPQNSQSTTSQSTQ